MADEPIPSQNYDASTNAAIIASGRDPSFLGAVFEAALNKTDGSVNARFRLRRMPSLRLSSASAPSAIPRAARSRWARAAPCNRRASTLPRSKSGKAERDGRHRKLRQSCFRAWQSDTALPGHGPRVRIWFRRIAGRAANRELHSRARRGRSISTGPNPNDRALRTIDHRPVMFR